MKYVIVSPRLGKPGDVYEPDAFINVAALLEGGFIKKVLDAAVPAEETAEESAPAPAKSAKTNSKKHATEE